MAMLMTKPRVNIFEPPRLPLNLFEKPNFDPNIDLVKKNIRVYNNVQKEHERLEQERLEQERLEQERLEKERLEQERLEKERREKERLEEQERLEKERLEQERLEHERLEKERLEKERLEQERLEQERLEQERLEKEIGNAVRVSTKTVEKLNELKNENQDTESMMKEDELSSNYRKEKQERQNVATEFMQNVNKDAIKEVDNKNAVKRSVSVANAVSKSLETEQITKENLEELVQNALSNDATPRAQEQENESSTVNPSKPVARERPPRIGLFFPPKLPLGIFTPPVVNEFENKDKDTVHIEDAIHEQHEDDIISKKIKDAIRVARSVESYGADNDEIKNVIRVSNKIYSNERKEERKQVEEEEDDDDPIIKKIKEVIRVAKSVENYKNSQEEIQNKKVDSNIEDSNIEKSDIVDSNIENSVVEKEEDEAQNKAGSTTGVIFSKKDNDGNWVIDKKKLFV
jgi:hypothetical protein